MNISLKMADLIKSVGKKLGDSFIASGDGLSMEYFFMLNILYEKDDMIQNDLAALMHKDKSAILRQIDVLEKLKMVVRVPDKDDRRKKTIVLTKEGVRKVELFRKIEIDLFNELLNDVSESDLEIFESVLDRMKSKVG